jgi:hypothetical protein
MNNNKATSTDLASAMRYALGAINCAIDISIVNNCSNLGYIEIDRETSLRLRMPIEWENKRVWGEAVAASIPPGLFQAAIARVGLRALQIERMLKAVDGVYERIEYIGPQIGRMCMEDVFRIVLFDEPLLSAQTVDGFSKYYKQLTERRDDMSYAIRTIAVQWFGCNGIRADGTLMEAF